MAVKQYDIVGIGNVSIYKRRGTKSLRLSITADARVRVTIPAWAPYTAGVQFAIARVAWIEKHRPNTNLHMDHGQHIGKAHRLAFSAASVDRPTSRIVGTEIRIYHPLTHGRDHPAVQQAAVRASVRALRTQAETLLPTRLHDLARDHGFAYASVRIKQLKSRWGSCDAERHIVLNLFLMQLPWQLIDYVLIHELVHTKVLHHGSDFWQEFLSNEPKAREYQRTIRMHKAALDAVAISDTVA